MTKHLLKTFVAFVAIAAMATGPARAQSNSEQLFYTLDGTQTGGSAYYYPSNVITQGGITWSVTGNTAINPWRIGGKSLNAVDRDVYCEGSLDETITKVKLDFGDAANITVNSVTMIVASDAAFNNVIESKSVNFSANSNVDVTPGTGIEWTDAYYKFVFNVSVSGSTNKYFQLKSIKFYYTSGGSTPEPEPAPAVPHTVRFAAGNDGWQVQDVTAATSAEAPAVLQNVMAGDSLVVTAPASLNRKVKSVKAVKYVAPPTLLDNTTTAWADGKYAVPAGGLTYSDAITVSGNVTLVLTDGTTLTLNKGISLASGATLTIQGNGAMVVNGTNENTTSTVAGSTGTLILTSGTLTATGGNGGSVDVVESDAHGGNGGVAINGSVIVSGGTLTATGGNGGSVDFQSAYCSGGNGGVAISGSVTVNSGTLTATGGNGGSVGDYGYNCNGGAGSAAISGDLTINRGTETLTNGANGQLGQYNDDCSAGAGGKAVAGTVTDNR